MFGDIHGLYQHNLIGTIKIFSGITLGFTLLLRCLFIAHNNLNQIRAKLVNSHIWCYNLIEFIFYSVLRKKI